MREAGAEGMMVKLKMIVRHHLSSDIKSLMRTASNLCVKFWKIDIFAVVSHSIQGSNRLFHLFCTLSYISQGYFYSFVHVQFGTFLINSYQVIF